MYRSRLNTQNGEYTVIGEGNKVNKKLIKKQLISVVNWIKEEKMKETLFIEKKQYALFFAEWLKEYEERER